MWLSQIWAISVFNLKNLKERFGASSVIVTGIAGVVLVLVGLLSIATGFRATMTSTGDPATVLIMRAGSTDEMSSGILLDTTRIVADAPGIARGESGVLTSAELYVIIDLPKRGTDTPANVPLRGVSPGAYGVRGDFEIVDGRAFEPGRNEVIVGEAAASQFVGLELGSRISAGETSWEVVGLFSTGGTVFDGEIWCDARVLQPAYRRGNSFQSVHVRLESGEAFQGFKDVLTSDPRLSVDVQRTADYYTGQSEGLTALITGLGAVIGLLMGFGAVFGALNTMYTAVSARSREIATLRALGFGASPVVISVLVEAVILAAFGGLAGAFVAYYLFNGMQTATLNWQTFSQVAFAFQVTPALMVGGFVYALAMGFVGGLFPAVRAARLPVATALREL